MRSMSRPRGRIFRWLLSRLDAGHGLRRGREEIAATIHEGGDLRVASIAFEIGKDFLHPFQIRMTRLHRRSSTHKIPTKLAADRGQDSYRPRARSRVHGRAQSDTARRIVSRHRASTGNQVKKRFDGSGNTPRMNSRSALFRGGSV